jgi:hypothetical protein
MTQALYAHVNNKTIKKKTQRKANFSFSERERQICCGIDVILKQHLTSGLPGFGFFGFFFLVFFWHWGLN